MNILTNIIRGGQLCLHAMRMFRQVIKILAIVEICIFLIAFCWKVYNGTSEKVLKIVGDYYLASFFDALGFNRMWLNVTYYSRAHRFRVETIMETDYFYKAARSFEDLLYNSAISALWVSLVPVALLSVLFVYKGFNKTGESFKRGAQMEEFHTIKKRITKENGKNRYNAFTIGGMPYSIQGESQHTMVIGANGVGKTVLISDLVEQIRARGDKAIIYDKKCDYIRWFYNEEKDFILNPFDERGIKWNLLGEMENIGHIKPLTQAFIPDKPNHSGDSGIWEGAARVALSGILEKMVLDNKTLTNKEIVDQVLKRDMKDVAKLVQGTHAQSILDVNSPKTASSVLFVIAAHLNTLRLTSGTIKESFSIRKWVQDKQRDSILFITSQEDLSSELIPLQTAWLEIAISSILSNNNHGNQKTWIILDELPTLQKIPSLGKGLSVSRSYGGCFVLGVQNIAQMRERYGKNQTEDLSSECNTRCIFKSNDPDTARWMAQNIGQSEVREFNEGLSYGANTMRDGINISSQDKMKSLVLPSEIQSMARLSLLIKMPDYPVVKAKINYKERVSKELAYLKNEAVLKDVNKIHQELAEQFPQETSASNQEQGEDKNTDADEDQTEPIKDKLIM